MPALAAIDTTGLLVTPEELEAAALESLAIDVGPVPGPGVGEGEDYQQVAFALADAQARVDGYISRTLLAHLVTERFDWRRGPVFVYDGRSYGRWLEAWPFVALTDDSDFTVADHGFEVDEARPGAQFARVTTWPDLTTIPSALVYVAGYRGRQHTLDGAGGTTALTDLPGLADLATLPPLVPPDVRRTIVELALLYLNAARQGTLGTGARIQQVGSGASQTIEKADPEAEERTLRRLSPYRNLSV